MQVIVYGQIYSESTRSCLSKAHDSTKLQQEVPLSKLTYFQYKVNMFQIKWDNEKVGTFS